jgi:hypothetical protein
VADERVAALYLFDHVLRERPAADHVPQILGNLLDVLRCAVRQK